MKYYKDLSCWYYGIGIVGGILLFSVLSVLLPYVSNGMILLYVWMVCMVVWILCCVMFFQMLAGKRLNKLARIRAEECRMEDFKNAWEKFQKQKSSFLIKQGRYNYEESVALNLSAAYLDLGDAEKSLELLQSMPTVFVNNASGDNYKIVYYGNLATTYLRLHNVEQAEEMLEQMKECLEHSRISKANQDMHERFYQMKQVLLAMERGNYEGAESFFRENIRKEDSKLTKVYNHYCLAEIYRHFGNEEEERACLTFVADNGGDSMYAREAGRRLEFLKLQ